MTFAATRQNKPRPKRSKPLDAYPGSKDAAGVREKTIALYPDHSIYVEAFLGGGAIMRQKTPAIRTIGIDLDPKVVQAWRGTDYPGLELHCADAVEWLAAAASWIPDDALVNLDPPYVTKTRRRAKIYRKEMTDDQHRTLIAVADRLPCSVFLHGYASKLYDESPILKTWKRIEIPTMSHRGPVVEVVWYRISLAGFAIDRKIVGGDFRERERIKRLRNRWVAQFAARPIGDRKAILQALLDHHHTTGNER